MVLHNWPAIILDLTVIHIVIIVVRKCNKENNTRKGTGTARVGELDSAWPGKGSSRKWYVRKPGLSRDSKQYCASPVSHSYMEHDLLKVGRLLLSQKEEAP